MALWLECCWYMDLKVLGLIPSNPQIFNNVDGAGGGYHIEIMKNPEYVGGAR